MSTSCAQRTTRCSWSMVYSSSQPIRLYSQTERAIHFRFFHFSSEYQFPKTWKPADVQYYIIWQSNLGNRNVNPTGFEPRTSRSWGAIVGRALSTKELSRQLTHLSIALHYLCFRDMATHFDSWAGQSTTRRLTLVCAGRSSHILTFKAWRPILAALYPGPQVCISVHGRHGIRESLVIRAVWIKNSIPPVSIEIGVFLTLIIMGPSDRT
jgi:hypothetical protein